MFSIIILTYNEESALAKCFESISWCDDIVVIDSCSTDKTVELAEKMGARVFERAFDNFGGQRNFAIDEVDFKHDWVFHLDADETFTDALQRECDAIVEKSLYGAYLVPSKMMLWGKWLKYSATYPVYQMRFHKIGEARFEQFGHGQRECELKRGLGTLLEPYDHHSFEKGFAHWFTRHNRYSSEEAAKSLEELGSADFQLSGLFSSNNLKRRRTLKQVSFRLPARAFLKFNYMFFVRLGFLDGRAGFTYCLLHAIYEQMIVFKAKEIQLSKKGINT